ncbi:hypothetical protein DYB37_000376 [Aphanomyces astaci]|uniref:Uncharacterized protein n=1 Tax=Aphanomyces astaci TaxID=112090 RepID=A0A3R7B1L9_APHAT|nr:hypothetical protein DYB35_001304 [Aphanomyces astaci]RHZ34699.1 hypothetical protein DYB37_000376 [Aphanomyces astaci]
MAHPSPDDEPPTTTSTATVSSVMSLLILVMTAEGTCFVLRRAVESSLGTLTLHMHTQFVESFLPSQHNSVDTVQDNNRSSSPDMSSPDDPDIEHSLLVCLHTGDVLHVTPSSSMVLEHGDSLQCGRAYVLSGVKAKDVASSCDAFGYFDGHVKLKDAGTGQLRWSIQLPDALLTMATINLFQDGDEEVMLCCWNGDVFIVNTAGSQLKFTIPFSISAFFSAVLATLQRRWQQPHAAAFDSTDAPTLQQCIRACVYASNSIFSAPPPLPTTHPLPADPPVDVTEDGGADIITTHNEHHNISKADHYNVMEQENESGYLQEPSMDVQTVPITHTIPSSTEVVDGEDQPKQEVVAMIDVVVTPPSNAPNDNITPTLSDADYSEEDAPPSVVASTIGDVVVAPAAPPSSPLRSTNVPHTRSFDGGADEAAVTDTPAASSSPGPTSRRRRDRKASHRRKNNDA